MRRLVPIFRLLPWVAGLGACAARDPEPAANSACEGVELLVAASNFQGSSVVCGAPVCSENARTTGADLGADPALSLTNGRAFFLARDKDLVFEIDATCGVPTAKLDLHTFAKPSKSGTLRTANAHDLAATSDGTIFATLFNSGAIGVLGKDGPLDPIDLASYDDDGNPNPEAIRILDVEGVPKAFVTLELLDNTQLQLPPKRSAQLLRIDVATRKVEAAVDLIGWNPFNVMAERDGFLFLAEPRNVDAAGEDFAGIERFDTRTSTSRMLVTEKDLGASVMEVAVTEGCGVAIVAGPEHTVNPTSLVTFDPDTGAILTKGSTALLTTDGYDLEGLAFRGDVLYVGDRRATTGGYPVHVFERANAKEPCTFTEASRAILLPQKPVALRAAQPPR